MDERRTLRILGWTIGGVVAMMFILNGIALSLTSREPALAGSQVAARNGPAPAPAIRFDRTKIAVKPIRL